MEKEELNISIQALLEATDPKVERLREICDPAPYLISIRRMSSGRVIFVNTAFEESTGFSRDEIIGLRPDQILVWASRADEERFTKGVLLGTIRDEHLALRTKDGRRIMVVVNARKIQAGDELYVVAVSEVLDRPPGFKRSP